MVEYCVICRNSENLFSFRGVLSVQATLSRLSVFGTFPVPQLCQIFFDVSSSINHMGVFFVLIFIGFIQTHLNNAIGLFDVVFPLFPLF